MKKFIAHLNDHFFFYTIFFSIIVISIFSYYRFMVNLDYLVSYEGECDPNTQKCFVGCEDEECSAEYYYSIVEKSAKDLYKECGKNIEGCEVANICTKTDNICSISFCSEDIDGSLCDIITNTNEINL